MDRGMFLNLPATEGMSFSATYYVQTRGGEGGSIYLHCHSLTCGKSSVDMGWWWGIKTSLLCEQITIWGRDSLFALGESHIGSGTCYTKCHGPYPWNMDLDAWLSYWTYIT